MFKASDVLELTADAYQYARRATLDDFQLERESVDALRKYDNVFKRIIQNRIDTKVDDEADDKRECRDQLGAYFSLLLPRAYKEKRACNYRSAKYEVGEWAGFHTLKIAISKMILLTSN